MSTLQPGQLVPPAIAWASLAVCGAAAVLGGLSMQANGLALTDLAGALGLSADDASWVTTAGSVGEGAAVLLAAPLVGAFGVRRVIFYAAVGTGVAAAASQILPEALLAIRFVQACFCGVLPVVMMVWAMRGFPPPQRGLPLMLFAFASSFPSALAVSLAGLATSHLSGDGVFVLDLVWTPVVALLAFTLLPSEPAQPERLKALDWPGYVLLVAAVGCLLVVLSQGERRFWFETGWIATLTAIAIVCLGLASARLLSASSPLLDLSLLTRPTFAIGMAEALSLRFGILMASFAVPQALLRLQGFRAEQAGEAVIWLTAGQLVGFPLAYLWLEKRDARWTLGFGLAVFAAAALWSALLDASWSVEQFRAPLALAGFGQGFFLTSVMRFATWNIPPPAGATAAGLFNLTRVLGTAGATALVGHLLRIRENGHSARLVEALTPASDAANARLEDLVRSYAAITPDGAAAQGAAVAALSAQASKQAFALAFVDVFLAIALVLAMFALLVPLLPALPSSLPATPAPAPEHAP